MTYADDFNVRSAANVSLTNIGDALDGLMLAYQQVTGTATFTCAVTTYTDITDMSKSVAVADGEAVRVEFFGTVAAATANDIVFIGLARDSTALGETYVAWPANNYQMQVQYNIVDAPSAGTYTYKARALNASGARNVNIYIRHFRVLVFQNS